MSDLCRSAVALRDTGYTRAALVLWQLTFARPLTLQAGMARRGQAAVTYAAATNVPLRSVLELRSWVEDHRNWYPMLWLPETNSLPCQTQMIFGQTGAAPGEHAFARAAAEAGLGL